MERKGASAVAAAGRSSSFLGAVGLVATLFCSTAASAADDGNPVEDYFSNWFKRVDQTQAQQPHWMTPVATVTPRLEEEVRYDQFWQKLPANGARMTNFDGGKGLELIPDEHIELLFNAPPYQQRSWNGHNSPPVDGFGDWPFLTVKYRILSANEENGNYIVSAFLGASAPTGDDAFTNHQYVVTPTIAFGKGWGDFDIQGTLSETIPMGSVAHSTVQQFISNTTFQYHVADYFWPELEVNYTYWPDGPKTGKNQVFFTPGVIVGRFPLVDRLKLIVGVGYQIAATPTVPAYRNNAILTTRLAF